MNLRLVGLIFFLWATVSVLAQRGPINESSQVAELDAASLALRQVQQRHAPDFHTSVFSIIATVADDKATLSGEVSNPAAKAAALEAIRDAGFEVVDEIIVLPAAELGEETKGIARLSVASGREEPGHSAELGTQVLMGHPVSILKQSRGWYLVQSEDRYLSWVQRGSIVRCNQAKLDEWKRSLLLIVTAFEDRVLEKNGFEAQPVSDVVPGCLVKKISEDGDWFKVELPDGRSGFLPKKSATDYAEWKRTRQPAPAAIERTARTFLGRPYLWGGNSSKGMDCSGFTKLVYFLNGVELDRNASHQARQGTEVSLEDDLKHLKKGDLLFFGSSRGEKPRVTHVGIYLGDKLFIHSSEMVRINSLDPDSTIADSRLIRSLLFARRVLPDSEEISF